MNFKVQNKYKAKNQSSPGIQNKNVSRGTAVTMLI